MAKLSEIRQTIKFAEEIDIDYVKIMVAMPLRHTELYETACNKECLRSDFNFYNMRWGYGEIETDEFSSFDTAVLRVYEWDRINFASSEKIEKIADLMGVTKHEIERIRKDTRKSIQDYFTRLSGKLISP